MNAASPPSAVRISIVTPTLNRAHFLGEAIESVLAQGVNDVEHIVVDGMSADGTVELLARHPHLRVIREPDRGVYDALNKGLRAASGDVIALLNSDDLLAPGALDAAARAFADRAVATVVGQAEIFSGTQTVETIRDADALRLCFRNITLGNPLPNARFFRRDLIVRTGDFDIRYRLASDRDWLLRMARQHPREVVLPALVYRYRRHDGSLTINDHSPLAEPLWRESLAIAGEWLARADLADDERATLRAWRRQQSIQASLHFLRHGPRARAAEFIRHGAVDGKFAGEWLREFGKAARGFVKKK